MTPSITPPSIQDQTILVADLIGRIATATADERLGLVVGLGGAVLVLADLDPELATVYRRDAQRVASYVAILPVDRAKDRLLMLANDYRSLAASPPTPKHRALDLE